MNNNIILYICVSDVMNGVLVVGFCLLLLFLIVAAAGAVFVLCIKINISIYMVMGDGNVPLKCTLVAYKRARVKIEN